jgi:hypothetical protein
MAKLLAENFSLVNNQINAPIDHGKIALSTQVSERLLNHLLAGITLALNLRHPRHNLIHDCLWFDARVLTKGRDVVVDF